MTNHSMQGTPYRSEGPQPLVREIPAGDVYPVEALGPLRGAVEAVQGMTQAPLPGPPCYPAVNCPRTAVFGGEILLPMPTRASTTSHSPTSTLTATKPFCSSGNCGDTDARNAPHNEANKMSHTLS